MQTRAASQAGNGGRQPATNSNSGTTRHRHTDEPSQPMSPRTIKAKRILATALQDVRDHGLSILEARRQMEMSHPSGKPGHASAGNMDSAKDLYIMTARLTKALVIPAQYRGENAQDYRFLPADDLYEIVEPDLIRGCLKELDICDMSTETVVDLENVVDYICRSPQTPSGTPTARRLFAIFVLFFDPSLILDFYHESVYDRDLPFTREPNLGSLTLFKVLNNDGTRITSFDCWHMRDAKEFINTYQWWFFVPFFAEDMSKPGTLLLPRYHLYNDAILPFTEWTESPVLQGNNGVRQVHIHPSQHRFEHTANPKNKVCIHPSQHGFPSVSPRPTFGSSRDPRFRVADAHIPITEERLLRVEDTQT